MKLSSDPAFDHFWVVYPRRVAKLDALKAWKQLKPDAETVEAILTALEWQRQQEQWRKDGGRYIPYPATWLRAGCWMDEPVRVVSRQVPEYDWFEECQRLHNRRCNGRVGHDTQMYLDRERAKMQLADGETR